MTPRPPVAGLNIVLIGPPGSGKGTQAARIKECFGLPHVSTGDILRAAVKAKSPLGLQVQRTMDEGSLVDDELIVDLVRHRLAQPDAEKGVILDGFPRTVVQAKTLDEMMASRPLVAVALAVPERELIRRLTSRRICITCKMLHTGGTAYGSEEELCSRCRSPLITRSDDNEETVRTRLSTFRATADPMIAHYRRLGSLIEMNGMRSPDEVTADIVSGLRRVTAMRSPLMRP
ncbi:MAG: adenylate kinase [Acidobacteriota bacterium]